MDNEPDWSDDDAIYDADIVELMPGIHTNELELYEPLQEYRDGAIKSSIEGRESGQLVYRKPISGCSVSVTRLLWVDGWRDNTRSEAMTLVVLKLGFKPETSTAKVTHASVQLRLKSDKKEDQDPRLVAWGPFRQPEMWNGVQAHRRISVTPSVKLSFAGAGPEGSVGVDTTREIEWDEPYTDYGVSSEKFSEPEKDSEPEKKSKPEKDSECDKRSPNGVLWQVFQNGRLKRGITPEVRVAALFSRPPADHYRAEVRIVVDTGVGSKILHWGMGLVNQKGGDKVYWRAKGRPGSRDNCHAEGNDIIKHVELDNLGKLVDPSDSTNLDPKWLNKWERVEMPKVTPEPEATHMQAVAEQLVITKQTTTATAAYSSNLQREGRELSSGSEEASKNKVQMRQVWLDAADPMGKPPSSSHSAVSLATSTLQLESTGAQGDNTHPQPSGDPGVVSATSRSPDLHYNSRLVALEDRAARAEARIAEQDRYIVELQRKLTRVAQALLTDGR